MIIYPDHLDTNKHQPMRMEDIRHEQMHSYSVHRALSVILSLLLSLCLPARPDVLISPARAAERETTISEAVSAALSHHPIIASTREQTTAAQENLKAAHAGYLPNLDARYAGGYEHADNPSTKDATGDDEDLGREEFSLVLRQNIFDGGVTGHAVNIAKAGTELRSHEIASLSQTVALRAATAFLSIQKGRRQLSLASGNLDNHHGLQDLVRKRVESKVASQPDINQAIARTREAEAILHRTRGELEAALNAYRAVIGQEPDSLAETFLPPSLLPPSPEAATALAFVANPDLGKARAAIEQAREELNRRRSLYAPVIDAELSLSRNRNLGGIPGNSDATQAMVVARGNIFAGGSYSSREREAVHLLKKAQHDIAALELDISEQVKGGYNALAVAQSRKEAFAAQTLANEGVKDAFLGQYLVGKKNLLDLLDAERELFLSRNNLEEERHQETVAVLRILQLQGGLLAALDLPSPAGNSGVKDIAMNDDSAPKETD